MNTDLLATLANNLSHRGTSRVEWLGGLLVAVVVDATDEEPKK